MCFQVQGIHHQFKSQLRLRPLSLDFLLVKLLDFVRVPLSVFKASV
jgi:hypothetical protein